MKPARKKNTKKNEIIDVHELAKGLKPGEFKKIGENFYIVPVFVLDPPEPIKKRPKAKSAKK